MRTQDSSLIADHSSLTTSPSLELQADKAADCGNGECQSLPCRGCRMNRKEVHADCVKGNHQDSRQNAANQNDLQASFLAGALKTREQRTEQSTHNRGQQK